MLGGQEQSPPVSMGKAHLFFSSLSQSLSLSTTDKHT